MNSASPSGASRSFTGLDPNYCGGPGQMINGSAIPLNTAKYSMMMKLRSTLLTTLLLCIASLASAADHDSQINAIMTETGFDKLVEHIPEFAQNTLKQSSGALEPQVNSSLSKAFNQSFASATVRKDVLAVIQAHYDDKQGAAYLQRLQSPLSKKIAELERRTNEAGNRDDFAAFAQALKTKPAPARRIKQIERLDKATHITDFGVDLQAALFKAVFTAVNPVMDEEMRVGDSEMEKMVKEVRHSFSGAYKEGTQISYLYTFRSLSDQELEEYIKLCESSDYRWGVQLLGNAMISALNQAAERAAVLMAQNNQ